MKIQGRLFIVSGGSTGLGLGAVRELVSNGAYVANLGRSQPKEDLPNTIFIKTDISSLPSIEQALEKVKAWSAETGAPIRGVINCAGTVVNSKLIDRGNVTHDLELWDRVIALNQTGTFHLTRLVVKAMADLPPEEGEDAERGVVIMIASGAAFYGQAGMTAYSGTKGAIVSMTQPMALDLGPYGIRVVTIAPGLFTSQLSHTIPEQRRNKIVDLGITFPKRFGHPSEFGMTVKYVLECSYLNGEVIKLHAGERIPVKLPKSRL